MRSVFLLPAALTILAACQPPSPPTTTPPETECGANDLAHLIGTNQQTLANHTGPLRLLPPNSAMTMDHSPARLNADLDADGTITRLWCG